LSGMYGFIIKVNNVSSVVEVRVIGEPLLDRCECIIGSI